MSPGGADLVPTARDWPAWVGFMVTTHFDLVSGPFHSPIFIGLHSVSTSANMYHLNKRAGELPRSASSNFSILKNFLWYKEIHLSIMINCSQVGRGS